MVLHCGNYDQHSICLLPIHRRTDLGIVRETNPLKKKTIKNFHCPVMLVAGDYSPHVDDTVNMNGRLDPGQSTWMKVW